MAHALQQRKDGARWRWYAGENLLGGGVGGGAVHERVRQKKIQRMRER
jgi:hypothetical protein